MAEPTMIEALEPRKIEGYGWKPDLPDNRDLTMATVMRSLKRLPSSVRKFSQRANFPEGPYDQLKLGSCTGNGVAGVVQFELAKQGMTAFRPSRLAIYYGERVIEGTVDSDAGAFIRDGIKVVAKIGAGPEDLWPYDISKFKDTPPPEYFAAAQKDLALIYARATLTIHSIKTLIYNGFPVVFGFSVYSSFEQSENMSQGLMPMPAHGENMIGGHCTVWTGWDDTLSIPSPAGTTTGAMETRNSWGPNVHDHGYFWMPFPFVTGGDCSDAWTIRMLKAGA